MKPLLFDMRPVSVFYTETWAHANTRTREYFSALFFTEVTSTMSSAGTHDVQFFFRKLHLSRAAYLPCQKRRSVRSREVVRFDRYTHR